MIHIGSIGTDSNYWFLLQTLIGITDTYVTTERYIQRFSIIHINTIKIFWFFSCSEPIPIVFHTY